MDATHGVVCTGFVIVTWVLQVPTKLICMWLPVVIAELLSLAIDLAKNKAKTKHLGMASIFLFINGGYIYLQCDRRLHDKGK